MDGFASFVQRVGADKHMVSFCPLGEMLSTSGPIFYLIGSFHKYTGIMRAVYWLLIITNVDIGDLNDMHSG